MKGTIVTITAKNSDEALKILDVIHPGEDGFTLDYLVRTPDELIHELMYEFSDGVKGSLPPFSMLYDGNNKTISQMRIIRIKEFLDSPDANAAPYEERKYLRKLVQLHEDYGHCTATSWRREFWGCAEDAAMFMIEDEKISFTIDMFPHWWARALVQTMKKHAPFEIRYKPVNDQGIGGVIHAKDGYIVSNIPTAHGHVTVDHRQRRI